jgi:hypothetical protein
VFLELSTSREPVRDGEEQVVGDGVDDVEEVD